MRPGLRACGSKGLRALQALGSEGLMEIRLIRLIGLLAGSHSHTVTPSHSHVLFVASVPLVAGVSLVPSGKVCHHPATAARNA